jgi:hypothetical protein
LNSIIVTSINVSWGSETTGHVFSFSFVLVMAFSSSAPATRRPARGEQSEEAPGLDGAGRASRVRLVGRACAGSARLVLLEAHPLRPCVHPLLLRRYDRSKAMQINGNRSHLGQTSSAAYPCSYTPWMETRGWAPPPSRDPAAPTGSSPVSLGRRRGAASCNTSQHNTAQHSIAKHITTQHNTTRVL